MSANNVIWLMRYENEFHVFYSGCVDNEPEQPDYKDEFYKKFEDKNKAILYGHSIIEKIEKEWGPCGYVEYGLQMI